MTPDTRKPRHYFMISVVAGQIFPTAGGYTAEEQLGATSRIHSAAELDQAPQASRDRARQPDWLWILSGLEGEVLRRQ